MGNTDAPASHLETLAFAATSLLSLSTATVEGWARVSPTLSSPTAADTPSVDSKNRNNSTSSQSEPFAETPASVNHNANDAFTLISGDKVRKSPPAEDSPDEAEQSHFTERGSNLKEPSKLKPSTHRKSKQTPYARPLSHDKALCKSPSPATPFTAADDTRPANASPPPAAVDPFTVPVHDGQTRRVVRPRDCVAFIL
ncbi:hypothetical protein HK104_003573 [Borealophlyctis nickersoniae]|nr:hypothetical protein HK104_003573 [Borealophlyctis nickersoniae]